MADAYVSTHWHAKTGSEAEFTARWREALTWTKDNFAGLEHARLLRDEDDPAHFVSFIEWEDGAWVDRWQADPGYAQRLAGLAALCDEVKGGGYEEAVRVA
jgi:heme-degrading monooxygenase HmoA